MTWFAPDALFDGAALRAEAMVEITHGVITQIATRQGDTAAIKGTLSAGFVDLQVNGGGGVMVNTTPATDGLRQIAQAHHALGHDALSAAGSADDEVDLPLLEARRHVF